MLGCPHNAIEQVWLIASMLEGKKISAKTQLWVHTPARPARGRRAQRLLKMITDAGGVVMSDTCPAISRYAPKGTKVVATNSAKQAHYLPAIPAAGLVRHRQGLRQGRDDRPLERRPAMTDELGQQQDRPARPQGGRWLLPKARRSSRATRFPDGAASTSAKAR